MTPRDRVVSARDELGALHRALASCQQIPSCVTGHGPMARMQRHQFAHREYDPRVGPALLIESPVVMAGKASTEGQGQRCSDYVGERPSSGRRD
jgi:hypothetical protein